jgi:hypothetical protein
MSGLGELSVRAAQAALMAIMLGSYFAVCCRLATIRPTAAKRGTKAIKAVSATAALISSSIVKCIKKHPTSRFGAGHSTHLGNVPRQNMDAADILRAIEAALFLSNMRLTENIPYSVIAPARYHRNHAN